MNIITVIGNGFDLQIGLPTRYIDFFNWLKRELDPNENLEYIGSKKKFQSAGRIFNPHLGTYTVIDPQCVKKDLEDFLEKEIKMFKEKCSEIINASHGEIDWWTWYFLYIKKKEFNNWTDIEKEIEDVLLATSKNDVRRYSILTGSINKITEIESLSNYDIANYNEFSFDMISEIYWQKNFKNIILEKSSSGTSSGVIKINYNNLMDELRKFEKHFCAYLKYITKEKNYINLSSRLANVLFDYALNKSDDNIGNMYKDNLVLLNFNYLQPYLEYPNFDAINVHGAIKIDEIIFGVDETIKVPEGAEIFKKTYRKLFLTDAQKDLPKTCDYLMFYGHSLAKADYSYFQSLFDLYNIYDSDTKLIFFVNDMIDSGNKKGIISTTKAVYSLIHNYGERTHGEERGGNLLHKLLLENRIRIIRASKIDDFPPSNQQMNRQPGRTPEFSYSRN